MSDQIDYKKLFEEERRRGEEERRRGAEKDRRIEESERRADEEKLRADEEKLRADEEKLRADEEKLRADEEKLRAEKAEKLSSMTDFADFLSLCHHEIFLKLTIERNTLMSTGGGVMSANDKLYPRYLKPWADFGARHDATFALLERTFAQQPPLFPSLAFLNGLSNRLRNTVLASEEDLKSFECLAVEGCVLDALPHFIALVQQGVTANPSANELSAISFTNYPFGVIATEFDEEVKDESVQWCFQKSGDTLRPLFVIEYKAAHKIHDDSLRACLEPEAALTLMEDVTSVLTGRSLRNDDSHKAKRDIAQVITQSYHYMVDYGLQYTYMTTGSAIVFFYLDTADPTTLYYHVEEPKRMVQSTGGEDMKHSAVALILCFVLMAMTGQYMTSKWKKMVQATQPRWPFRYDGTHENAPRLDSTVTLGPPKIRPAAEGCGDPQRYFFRRDREDDGGPGPSSRPASKTVTLQSSVASTSTSSTTTPSTTTTTTTTTTTETTTTTQQALASQDWSRPANAPLTPAIPYCTLACLLGLKTGGAKDAKCPNVLLHRRGGANGTAKVVDDERHPISAEEFRVLLVEQLANDMDNDCHSLEQFGMYGAIGALFKLALSAYGYCFVGKGVQRAHRKRLAAEAAAYGFLEACQGRLVPVNLGIIELVDEYWTQCGAHISHMMLMSFAGESLWHIGRKTGDYTRYEAEVQRTLREMKPYGVVHEDVNSNNMVWNEELQRVLAIDFDHVDVEAVAKQEKKQEKRQLLVSIGPNVTSPT